MRELASNFLATIPQLKRIYISQKWIISLVKGLITILACLYVYNHISKEKELLLDAFAALSRPEYGLIGLVFLLCFLNLGCESLKWQWGLRPFYPSLGFVRAYWGVLSGITIGLFTPNRIGEYAGRLWYLQKGARKEAAILTFVSRIFQMQATLLAGTAGICLLASLGLSLTTHYPQLNPGLLLWAKGLLVLGTVTLLFALLFFPLKTLVKYTKLEWVERFTNEFGLRIKLHLLWLSVLRYCIFSLQYVLLMFAFGYEGSIAMAFVLVAVVFIVKSVIPSISLAELGIRESVAIAVMAIASIPATVAFLSTFLLFICNIIIPALIGLVGIYRLPNRLSLG